ncbi:hypothetical protein BH24ACT10_BH24ACT10_03310 [soil metagenome]
MASHTLVRLLHDVGAAAWFGGSLMGATGLNGAAAALDDPSQRHRASTAGWSRWAPVGGAAVIAHVIGSAGLARVDVPRVALQQGVGRSTKVRTALTGAGLGLSAWSLALNRKVAAHGSVPVQGATEPSAATPPDVAAAQRQLKIAQWLHPLVAGGIIVVGSWQDEQKRAAQTAQGMSKGLIGRLPTGPLLASLAATGVAVTALRKRRREPVEVYPQPVVRRPVEPSDDAYAGDPVSRITTGSVEREL